MRSRRYARGRRGRLRRPRSTASLELRNASHERSDLVMQFALAVLCKAPLGVLLVELRRAVLRLLVRQLRVLELRLVLVRPLLPFGCVLLRLRKVRTCRALRATAACDAHSLLFVVAL